MEEIVPNIWSSEQIISFDLHCVLKWTNIGDLIIDYQPLYNNKQFKVKLKELLDEFGFPEQELTRAELGMQDCPPICFEGVIPPKETEDKEC
tara:strand:+ start:2796 stop:3071 length:276 start_codon:yes stop_codon:yes gene_type:complete